MWDCSGFLQIRSQLYKNSLNNWIWFADDNALPILIVFAIIFNIMFAQLISFLENAIIIIIHNLVATIQQKTLVGWSIVTKIANCWQITKYFSLKFQYLIIYQSFLLNSPMLYLTNVFKSFIKHSTAQIAGWIIYNHCNLFYNLNNM